MCSLNLFSSHVVNDEITYYLFSRVFSTDKKRMFRTTSHFVTHLMGKRKDFPLSPFFFLFFRK